MPVHGVPGNWDYRVGSTWVEVNCLYRGHHGRLLVNETIRMHYGGADILMTGLDDLLMGWPDIATALRGATPAGNHLVIPLFGLPGSAAGTAFLRQRLRSPV